jgi:hypothetical protein
VNYYQAGHMIYTSDKANCSFSKDSEVFYANAISGELR